MRDVNSILEMVEKYIGDSVLFIVFLVCLIGMLSKLKRKEAAYAVGIILLSVLLVYNNVSIKLLGMLTDKATLYRFFWAVPVTIVIAWVCVNKFSELQGKPVKVVALGLAILLVAVGGNSYLSKESLTYPGTTEKIPGDVKKICEIINDNKQQERPICVFDLSIMLMVRCEEPSIVWAIPRKQYLGVLEQGYQDENSKYPRAENLIKVVNDGIQVPKKKLKRALRSKDVEFLVVKKEFQMTDYFMKMGISSVGESDNYVVYQFIPK